MANPNLLSDGSVNIHLQYPVAFFLSWQDFKRVGRSSLLTGNFCCN